MALNASTLHKVFVNKFEKKFSTSQKYWPLLGDLKTLNMVYTSCLMNCRTRKVRKISKLYRIIN